jgi:redox-sensitive bicupin YhaK (pirin superfamily)
VSNPDRAPVEVTCDGREGADRTDPVVLPSRQVPLGGPRAMLVRRSLPQRERSLIGAWCFVDHYGPADVSLTGGMVVPGHPHTGLQTVSWLFSGEIEHRDTTGAHAFVRPGEVNLMTAGRGIAHSEYSTPATTTLHGAQLWVALPEAHRFAEPGFEHYAPPVIDVDGARVLVFLGRLFGQESPVSMHSDLVGAEVTLPAGGSLDVAVDRTHEHGFLCDTGTVSAGDATAKPGEIVFVPSGPASITVQAGDDSTRLLLLGGAPLGERIVMWWNFIGRSHDEIVDYRERWQQARETRGGGEHDDYGAFPDAWATTLPAPELPNLRLRSRG